MLSLRNRFGIPGVISVIALVFAMLGGAYAASNSSGGGKATASAKAKKGPRGPKGATGPAGPAGPQGPAGANGKDGANGSNGLQGSQGLPGKSVEVANYSGPECAGSEEGATVQVAGEPATKKYICDGAEGAQGPSGPEGVCSTSSCHLPANVTETGAWGFRVDAEGEGAAPLQSAPFNVQLPAALDSAHVHTFKDSNFGDFDGAGSLTVGCTGSNAAPTAPSGHFCLYGEDLFGRLTSLFVNDPTTFSSGAAKTGALIQAIFSGGSEFADIASGTWAVTG